VDAWSRPYLVGNAVRHLVDSGRRPMFLRFVLFHCMRKLARMAEVVDLRLDQLL